MAIWLPQQQEKIFLSQIVKTWQKTAVNWHFYWTVNLPREPTPSSHHFSLAIRSAFPCSYQTEQKTYFCLLHTYSRYLYSWRFCCFLRLKKSLHTNPLSILRHSLFTVLYILGWDDFKTKSVSYGGNVPCTITSSNQLLTFSALKAQVLLTDFVFVESSTN